MDTEIIKRIQGHNARILKNEQEIKNLKAEIADLKFCISGLLRFEKERSEKDKRLGEGNQVHHSTIVLIVAPKLLSMTRLQSMRTGIKYSALWSVPIVI